MQPQPQTKPNQPIDGAPPRVIRVGRMTAAPRRGAPRKMNTVRRPVEPRPKTPFNMYTTPEEERKQRQEEERNDAIRRASLRDKAILKAWDERIKRAKRPIDDDEVEIVEPPAKKGRTGKKRVVDDETKRFN
ncbi:hypothetical protein BD769DRAFT_1660873 [Suillus cothurnatus]|nr:hypothetical protein BD769DRAFT_1660873 [Suillus cothurnatus]